jgi:hypothetical protein
MANSQNTVATGSLFMPQTIRLGIAVPSPMTGSVANPPPNTGQIWPRGNR